MACPITGVMRRMEIQRGKEGMRSEEFNSQVGASAGCTLRLLLGTIPKDADPYKHGIWADAWFGSIKTENEIGLRGHDAVLQIKQYHSLFPKEFIESALKDAPGGVHILLEGVTKDEVTLVAMGYRYSCKKCRKLKARRSLPNEVYRFVWEHLYLVC
jgi:hypothetical protein